MKLMAIARSNLTSNMQPKAGSAAVEWRVSDSPIAYQDAINFMDQRVLEIANGKAAEMVWLLEHPPLFTAGTSADSADLVQPDRFPVFKTGRGGQYTYHGPGQRVVYVMLDLKRRQPDVRAFVSALERWTIDTLQSFGVTGERREDRVGVWVKRPTRPAPAGETAEDKIAAIGIRLKKWVSLHGISINVEPELEHFSGIVPCGVQNHGVTSLVDLGLPVTMNDLDIELRKSFEAIFGSSVYID